MNSNNRKTAAAVRSLLPVWTFCTHPHFVCDPLSLIPLLILPTSFLLPSYPPTPYSHFPFAPHSSSLLPVWNLTPHSTSCVYPHPSASFPVWILTPHPHFLCEPSPLSFISCVHPHPSFHFLWEPSPLSFISCVNPHPLSPLPVWALTPQPHFLCESSLLTPTFFASYHPSFPFPGWTLALYSFFLCEPSPLSLTSYVNSHPLIPTCPSLLIPTSCLSPQHSFPLPVWALLSYPHHLCKPSPLIYTCLPPYSLSPLACCSHWLVNEKRILNDLCEWVSWGSEKDKACCHILFLPSTGSYKYPTVKQSESAFYGGLKWCCGPLSHW